MKSVSLRFSSMNTSWGIQVPILVLQKVGLNILNDLLAYFWSLNQIYYLLLYLRNLECCQINERANKGY